MRIQHNIMAMNAYRNYSNNISAMKSNLEKLSSGYKINRAGDDAAGLAISEKMRAQITGLETAQKNAKDGISLVQTAEGALTEVHDMLNRMVELATQSANGTYDNTTDRAQLQKELDQLRTEINRIADSSNFNGIKLLDGSMAVNTNYKLQNLVDGDLTIVADGQLGQNAQVGEFVYDLSKWSSTVQDGDTITLGAAGGNTVTIDVIDDLEFEEGAEINGSMLAAKLAEVINKYPDDFTFSGVQLEAVAEDGILTVTTSDVPTSEWTQNMRLEYRASNDNQANQFEPTIIKEPIDSSKIRKYGQATMDLNGAIKDGFALKIGDTTYTFAVGANSAFKGAENVVDLTDKTASSADLTKAAAARLSEVARNNASFFVGATDVDGVISFTEKEGAVDYTKNDLSGGDGIGGYHDDNANTANAQKATVANWKGLIKYGSTSMKGEGLTLQIGDTADSFNQLNVSINDCHAAAMGIDGVDISTQASAQAAVAKIKAAINYVSDVRGTLGATQNRLDHTINNLSVMTENIQDAESTIRDVDVAEEMMAYTKNNILIQASQAMLAQANQVPQGVLQLLQ